MVLLLAGCATPIEVERISPRRAERALTSNVITTGEISPDSKIVLQKNGLWQYYQSNPVAAIGLLHRAVQERRADADILFALSETSFHLAQESGDQRYYLAATVYAFAFLFPADPARRPDEFDPRLRVAVDIYNRGLTSTFASADRSDVTFHSGTFALPFGTIDIVFDPASARWGNAVLSKFVPADELKVSGLRNDYRKYGLGATLAADASPLVKQTGFQVAPLVKVPVTALLRIENSPGALAGGHLHGRIDVYPAFDPSTVSIDGQSVPLAASPTAALAYGLSDPQIWASEHAAFLNGSFLDRIPSQLVGLEPYRPGQFPVVFIHGTASSSGRWADMINDLESDPTIRDHFQFWAFQYNTGNPVAFSALQLRRDLQAAVTKLDPYGKDPALHNMVLIGHSQGGLLAKMLVVDSGPRIWNAVSKTPLEQLRVSEKTRELLREAVFLKPMPDVGRVIFIATPQRGSFVAGSWIGELAVRLVTLPLGIASALADTVNNNQLNVKRGAGAFNSVWGMNPGNPALNALADTPVAPNIAAHSIIAVQGNGPVETGDDGVVTYKSAHIDGVQSELVVRSAHSAQGEPLTIAEVRRILMLHLAQACAHGCSQPSVPDGEFVRPAQPGHASAPAPSATSIMSR